MATLLGAPAARDGSPRAWRVGADSPPVVGLQRGFSTVGDPVARSAGSDGGGDALSAAASAGSAAGAGADAGNGAGARTSAGAMDGGTAGGGGESTASMDGLLVTDEPEAAGSGDDVADAGFLLKRAAIDNWPAGLAPPDGFGAIEGFRKVGAGGT